MNIKKALINSSLRGAERPKGYPLVTRQSPTDRFHCRRLPRFARNDGNAELIRDSLEEIEYGNI